jgi:hypothetical protein
VAAFLGGCERASLSPESNRNAPRPARIAAELKHGPSTRVIADRMQVTLQLPSGERETIHWSEIHRIAIITTDEGPRMTDVFIVLESRGTRLLVPQDAQGNEGLVSLLVSIEGFDHETFINAMGSAENSEFTCWTGWKVSFRHQSPRN